jgi:transcriptional regulator with XRE-family HTH domain
VGVAYTLQFMAVASELVRDARSSAGLSRGALARNAGVPTSTVSRIEDGAMDPTMTMLRRVLAGASTRLIIQAGPLRDGPTIAVFATDASGEDRFVVDWTSLRGFADWAFRHPDDVAEAVEDPPARTGSPLDAILASFTEELCDSIGMARPRWTSDVGKQSPPWAPSGTPKMTLRAEARTPETFRRRGLTIARADLFPEPVPA